MEALVVVDMQNDFVSGALGTQEAFDIVPYVVGRVGEGIRRGEAIFFTRDTHEADYLERREGRCLPVPHCIRGTEGWEIIGQLQPDTIGRPVVDKTTFASTALGQMLADLDARRGPVRTVTLVGVCTDICVLANAVMLQAFLPEAEIVVEAGCCAGVTPERHRAALAAMEACQITVRRPEDGGCPSKPGD